MMVHYKVHQRRVYEHDRQPVSTAGFMKYRMLPEDGLIKFETFWS